MTRRALLCGMMLGTMSLPLRASAQRGARVYRIGVLSPLDVPAYMTPFVEGLRERGWVEGRDFIWNTGSVATPLRGRTRRRVSSLLPES